MNLNIIAVMGITFFLTSCGGGGSSGGGASVEGLNLSGTWRFAGVECYNNSFENITAVGVPTASSSVGTIVIQGNQLTSEDLGSGSCKVTMTRKIVANLQEGDANGGYGTGTFGETSASVSPSSPCDLSISFDMAQGNISPATLNSSYTEAQSVTKQSFEFLINPPYFAVASLIQVVGSPTDVCLLIYKKL